MANDEIMMKVHAFADGELDAESRAAIEELIAQNAIELKRELSFISKINMAAKALPVPAAGVRLETMWSEINAATSGLKNLSDGLNCVSIKVPEISNERFSAVWNKISSRTVTPSQFELERIQNSAIFDGEASGDSKRIPIQDKHAWAMLDTAARGLSVPRMSELTTKETWGAIVSQTGVTGRMGAAPAVPPVSDERWSTVWKNISGKIGNGASHVAQEKVIPASNLFQRSKRRTWWRTIIVGAGGLAAAVMMIFLLTNRTETSDMSASALDVPEALDDRYRVEVKYPDGNNEPVVCYFLNEKTDSSKQSWQWLPD